MSQPGGRRFSAVRHVVHEPVDDACAVRTTALHMVTSLSHHLVRRHAKTSQIARPRAIGPGGPCRQHRLVGLGVELRGEGPTRTNGLWSRWTGGHHLPSRRRGEDVEVPLQPRAGRNHLGDLGLHPVPANLGPSGPVHRPAQGVGDHLRAETDAENGNTSSCRLPDQGRFGLHVRTNPIPVHAPFGSEQQNQVVPGQVGPLPRALTQAFVEGETMMTQPLAHEPGVGIYRVGHQ